MPCPAVAAVHGVVWLDANANGIRTGGEAAYGGGATVKLLQNGQEIATTTTDANGQYAFGNLVPGAYAVQVVAPAGYGISPQGQGSDRTVDSDVDPTSGRSDAFSVVSGQDLAGPDAGLYQRVPAVWSEFSQFAVHWVVVREA